MSMTASGWGVVACGALVMLAGFVVAMRTRMRARRARRLFGPASRAFVEGEQVVFEGILRARIPVTTRTPAGADKPVRAVLGAVTQAVDEAYVEARVSDQGRTFHILLDETVQVVVGSQERRPESSGGTSHLLRDGDRVVAAGRLVRAANPGKSDGSTGYRDTAHVLRLVGTVDGPAVLLSASGARSRTAWITGAVGSLLLLVGLVPLLIGFARQHRPRCGPEIDGALARNDLLGAESSSASCSDPLARAHAAFARGDFKAAHAAFVEAAASPEHAPTVSEAQSASLAGDFADASRKTTLLAGAWYKGPETRESDRLKCIADAFGSRAAGERIETLTKEQLRHRQYDPNPDQGNPFCAFLAGDLESDHDTRMWALQCDDDSLQTRRLLFLEAGEKGDWFLGRNKGVSTLPTFYFDSTKDYPLPVAPADPVQWLMRRHVSLEDAVARALDAGQPIEHEVAAQAALFRAVMDDRPRAKAFLEKVAVPGGDRLAYIIGAVAAFYAGDRAMAERLLELGASVSDAVDFLSRSVLPALPGGTRELELSPTREPWKAEVFAAIETQDPSRVADAFAKDHQMHVLDVFRATAKLQGRDLAPLRAWLRKDFPAPPWDQGVNVVGLTLGAELLVAERLGDDEVARALRPRVAAFAAAMTSRAGRARRDDPTLVNDLLERAQGREPL